MGAAIRDILAAAKDESASKKVVLIGHPSANVTPSTPPSKQPTAAVLPIPDADHQTSAVQNVDDDFSNRNATEWASTIDDLPTPIDIDLTHLSLDVTKRHPTRTAIPKFSFRKRDPADEVKYLMTNDIISVGLVADEVLGDSVSYGL